MAPEILIVGDETRRSGLLRSVRALGYEADLCAVRDLNRRVRRGDAPAAIVLCTADANAAVVLAGLRRTRQGAAIPVVLLGRLGGEIRDLADVLDLGADHFIEEGGPDEELAAALEELAGPVVERTETNIRGRHDAARSWTETSVDADDGAGTGSGSAGTDPSIGQLHRTLDMLEARLRRRDAADDDVRQDLDLESMGLDAVPEVEGEEGDDLLDPGASHEAMPIIDDVAPRGHEATQYPVRASLPETTERLPAVRETDERSRRRSGPIEQEEAPARTRRSAATLPVDSHGSLSELGLPRLLHKLHRARFTGKLSVARGRVRKQLWMTDGAVMFARSNLSQDRLVDGLLRRGRLTRSQYETARRLAAKEPRRAGKILVEAGFIKPGELHDVLREHLASVVDSVFEWPEGDWKVSPGETTEEPVVLDVSTPQLVLGGIRRRLDSEGLLAQLGSNVYPRLSARVSEMAGGLTALADELGLSDPDLQLVGGLDGTASLGDLAATDVDAPGLVHGLEVLELVDLAGEPIPAAEGAGDPVDVDRERIRERLELARGADYFELLGLGRDASRAGVRRAYAELSQTFADASLEAATRRKLEAELRELRSALEEACMILSDDALRSAYLAHLEDA